MKASRNIRTSIIIHIHGYESHPEAWRGAVARRILNTIPITTLATPHHAFPRV